MRYLIFLFAIPFFSFCQSQTKLDGIWVGAYQISKSNTNSRISEIGPYIIEFEDEKCKTTYFNYQATGIAHSYSVESFKYEIQDNRIINKSDKNSDVLEIKNICNDSLVIGFQDIDDVVLKKVKIEESPYVNLENKAFTLKLENYIDSIDFISDTTFLHIGEVNKFQVERWLVYK